MARSSWRRIPFASIAAGLTADRTRLDSNNLRQLDTSHGCQNHTLLPYANCAARPARINRSQPQDKARDRPAMPRARNAIASTAARTPRIVTTRTPLFDEAGWREDGADLRKMRSGIFLPRNLDDPNHIEMAAEIRFCAQRVLRHFRRAAAWSRAETFSDLPDGQTGSSLTRTRRV